MIFNVGRPMLRKLIAALGLGTTVSLAVAAPPYSPYSDSAANGIYNLLFCDLAASFRSSPGQPATDWQAVLFQEPADVAALTALASSDATEDRVRVLAYNTLRALGITVPKGILLGVVVEAGFDGGVDTLAAFLDGDVRYINQTGKMAFFEGPVADFQPIVKNLMQSSATLVAKLSPSQRVRQPPPPKGNLRLTFLVSDGLYGGEGSFGAMQRNELAAPVVAGAQALLLKVVELGTAR